MSEKTEQPTPKKLRKAREDGQVAHSKDFTEAVLIVALFGYMLADASAVVQRLGEMMVMPAGVLSMEFEDAVNIVLSQLFKDLVRLLMPYLLIVICLGLFVEMLQTGMLVSFKSLIPSGKKLNVAENVKNIFGAKNLVDFLKSNIKVVVLSAVVYAVLKQELGGLMTLPRGDFVAVGVAVGILLKSMMVKIAIAYIIIAAADFVWQRHHHNKELMMSKDEVKQDFKEAEGDPHIKQHRRHLHQEMLNEGAVERSREASVVVTNPIHLAMAIRYVEEQTPLPVLIAKGEGALAARMVVAAREAGVPVMENVPLAWALNERAQVDQYIPSELVEPVAQVLKMVREMDNPDRGNQT